MEKSEDEFVAAVDDAMGKMKAVIESNDALRCLSDLVAIQLQYHKVSWWLSWFNGSFYHPND